MNHSKNAIVKPQGPTPQEEKREVEEAMKRIEAANKALAKAIDTSTNSGVLLSSNKNNIGGHDYISRALYLLI